MKLNYTITVCEDVSLVVLKDVPSDLCFISSVFDTLAQKGVNVDMISQVPPQGSMTRLAFTISDNDLGATLDVISGLREDYADIKSAVSSANTKITVISEEMRQLPGVAAAIFKSVAAVHADVRLVTTSEIDLSLLISEPNIEAVITAINACFE